MRNITNYQKDLQISRILKRAQKELMAGLRMNQEKAKAIETGKMVGEKEEDEAREVDVMIVAVEEGEKIMMEDTLDKNKSIRRRKILGELTVNKNLDQQPANHRISELKKESVSIAQRMMTLDHRQEDVVEVEGLETTTSRLMTMLRMVIQPKSLI